MSSHKAQLSIKNGYPFERKAKEIHIEYLQEKILDTKLFNEVLKIHQKSTWHFPYNWEIDHNIDEWLHLVENTDVLPDYYDNKVTFHISRSIKERSTSERNFYLDWTIQKNMLGNILYNAFGRGAGIPTKPYPSAGGLYPIIPIVIVFTDRVVQGEVNSGCYVFDSTNIELLRIKQFDQTLIQKILQNINIKDGKLSNIAIGYAMDIRRAITKYGVRGYRHGLIEVGLMAQSFRNALFRYKELGDCCWSGFNDNALTNLLGLNPRLAPLILLQWFGKKL
jgi:SagB-type dehydrogenase family enzyme